MSPLSVFPKDHRHLVPRQRENVYKTFRFTSKTSRQVVVFGAVVPAIIGAACYLNDVSEQTRRDRSAFIKTIQANQDWAGKKRGESLMVSAPAAVQQE